MTKEKSADMWKYFIGRIDCLGFGDEMDVYIRQGPVSMIICRLLAYAPRHKEETFTEIRKILDQL